MKFDDQYELLDWLQTDSEKTTFAARDIFSGQGVLVHVLPAVEPAEKSALADLARRQRDESGADNPGTVLKVSEYRGAVYIVTGIYSGFTTLQIWLEHLDQKSKELPTLKPAQMSSHASSETADAAPGEFTRLFGTYNEQPAQAEQDRGTPSLPVSGKKLSGDFHDPARTFEGEESGLDAAAASSNKSVSDDRPALSAKADPRLTAKSGLSEGQIGSSQIRPALFEEKPPEREKQDDLKIPLNVGASASSPIRIVPNDKANAARATGILSSSPSPKPGAVSPGGNGSSVESGEFTRMFYRAKSSLTLEPKKQPASGSWPPAVQFSKPAEPVEPELSVPSQWAPQVRWPEGKNPDHSEYFVRESIHSETQPASPEEPGEFTRIIEAVPQAKVTDSKESTTPTPTSEGSSAPTSYMGLTLILAGIFVIAVMVVLYFALKK